MKALVIVGVIIAFGLAMIIGGFSKYADQTSGTPGTAKVSSCTQGYNTKYVHRASTCTGSWIAGGDLVAGHGRVAVGTIEGADSGDEGKTIDVRIHGSDHATVPDLKTPIILWILGALVLGFGLWAVVGNLRRRRTADA
jgi:TRAP-type C4-dicarboxylate transport system permease small subunit